MKVQRLDRGTVSLQPKHLKLEQPANMNLFVITQSSLTFTNTTYDEERVSVKIVFKRKIMSEMMTTYFPSALLMLITFATTFFKPFFFEAALSVNLTTMLVMTTIFISKMEGLPPTSVTKMIDYWLILCQLVPFTEVVLLTAMEYQREDKHGKEEPAEVKDADGPEVLVEAWKAPKTEKGNFHMDLKMIGKFFLQI